ncbi:hypothetical protein [Prochlorococcus sp. MIT 1341]|uniref:hypothetical protein n=1 Tax=Prochlorococcus sp. MIT 1341 TaxID=3096221 RepID=UPI002A75E5CC|nr:hypothetical protein [Prochlorococcus sp. MIT 1341]
MISKLVFLYDGECPFCAHFAELLELKSGLPSIQIKNARENLFELPKGYDMDTKGALLKIENETLYGADAINWICCQIDNPTDSLLKILSVIFSSGKRTHFLFPLLLNARRITLLLKGVPRKIIYKHESSTDL